MASIDRPSAGVHSGPIALRTAQAPTQPAESGYPIIPPSRRPLSAIVADANLSNGAKLLARQLDGSCLAHGKWAAWPKVSTIADALGWVGDPRAFRKRVERAFRELIESGDVARPRLRDLVEWHDANGARKGLDWPKGIRRNLCRSAIVTILGWKLAEAEERLPSLTLCDIPVASSGPVASLAAVAAPSNVACHPPGMSHEPPPEMSHPTERSKWNVGSETTSSDAVAVASGQEETSPMPTDHVATVDRPAARPLWTDRELAEKLFGRLRDRGIILKAGHDPERGEVVRWEPQGPWVEAIRDDEAEQLRRLKPHVLAFLKGDPESKPDPTPPAHEGSPAPTVAPKVPRAVKARVTALIAALDSGSPASDDVAAGRAIAQALGDDKPLSIETFAGYARKARAGEMPRAVLIDAFEAACRKGKRNRGAFLVGLIQDWRSDHSGGSRGPGRRPAGEFP
jgi:hypothetical protein